jgi:hypothetical protein
MTTPSIGEWVWGEALNPCQVIAIGSKRGTGQTMLKVLCPQGARVIPLESVKGVAQQKPNLLGMPRPIQLGDRVQHRQTQHEFTVIEIYQHFMGWEDGDRTYESWARLMTDDGKIAHWKIQQLEVIV